MNKYERHGLTRAEDDILGTFGEDSEGNITGDVTNESITPEQRDVIKGMIRKGLLESRMRADFGVDFHLTPKGKALYRTRSTEEGESPDYSRSRDRPLRR